MDIIDSFIDSFSFYLPFLLLDQECQLTENVLFQGLPLSHSAENGVIFTNYSLVLQKINQARAGSYMCESSNQVGKGRSEEIILDVKCKF